MHIKATIVAYAFSVQYFENVTIVAYVGVRVNSGHVYTFSTMYIYQSRPFHNGIPQVKMQ